MKSPKIVVIGGGTGTFEILSGLKKHTPELTALINMADDGGSTGQLRDEYGVLPPGDVRKALVALAGTPQMRDLFNYRFEEGSLDGHSFGNLFLTAVEKMSDNFSSAVQLAGKVLNIKGQVLPITLDRVTLVLEEQGGRTIRGEHNLDGNISFQTQRPKVRLEPRARITPEARTAILEADIIVIAPGSLYGSLAAALVVDGVGEALAESKAPKVFVCNLVTEHGQTDGMAVHDLAAEIERFMGGKARLDCVLYNTHKPAPELLENYAEEGRTWIPYDQTVLNSRHYAAIGDNFVTNTPKQRGALIRHNTDKVAATLLQIARSHGRVRRMKCTKAIIPIAGYGTRRLPITKAIEKCMLPVGNRPVIDYIVEDCIRAGITEFMFVVGEEFDQIRRYYGQNQLLEEYLESKGKEAELQVVRDLDRKARFRYVVQDQYQPYGTTSPVWLCRHLVKPDEKVLVVYGDAFFHREDGSSELADFLNQADDADAPSAMLANQIPWKDVSNYGIVVTKEQDGKELYEKIIEKPKREEAPTNLGNPGCYVFDYSIFKFADQNLEQNQAGEHQLTDVINDYVNAGNQMAVIRAKGEYLDCGTTEAWLHTNQRILNS